MHTRYTNERDTTNEGTTLYRTRHAGWLASWRRGRASSWPRRGPAFFRGILLFACSRCSRRPPMYAYALQLYAYPESMCVQKCAEQQPGDRIKRSQMPQDDRSELCILKINIIMWFYEIFISHRSTKHQSPFHWYLGTLEEGALLCIDYA